MYLLLVDQKFITSDDLKSMIEKSPAGTDIVNCFSTETLLKIAEKVSPDIVIVDFDMVGEDIDSLFKSIREKSSRAHLIALIDPGDYQRLNDVIESGGIDDYIAKPIQKEDFMARVHIAGRRIGEAGTKSADQAYEKPAQAAIPLGPPADESPAAKEDPDEPHAGDSDEDQFLFEEEEEELLFETGDQESETAAEDEITTGLDSLSFNGEPEPAVEDSLFEEQDLFEPEPVPEEGEEEKTAEPQSDFFDREEPVEPGETDEYKDQPDSSIMDEDTDLFEDLEVDEEELQLDQAEEVEKIDEDEEVPVEQQAEPDFNGLFDNKLDLISGPIPEAKTKFDTLFDDVPADKSGQQEEDEPDFFEESGESTEKVSPPSEPEAVETWDFPEDDLLKEQQKAEPPADLFKEAGDELLFDQPAVAAEAGEDIADDEFFNDLFDDDLFDEKTKTSPEEPPSKRKSPLPGQSADDFLFGDSEESDYEQVPETVKRYVVYRQAGEKKSVDDEDLFPDDFDFDHEAGPGRKPAQRRAEKSKGKKSGLGRIFNTIGNVVFVLLLLMMAVLSFFLIQSKISGGAPTVAGYQMYIVLSGSMSPEFDTGSLAFVRETGPEEIVVGDIITFRTQSGSDSLTTHRVVEVLREGELSFVTRGDANNVNDPYPVLADNVVGRVTGSIPYIGYLLNFVQTRQGLIFLIFIPGILIIVFELGKIMKYLTDGDGSKKKKRKAGYSAAADEFE
jgi:signal peptidase